jgi:hypothetical protein
MLVLIFFMCIRRKLGLHAKILGTYLIVVPRPLPAAPFLVRRRYLAVVPRPLHAAPLAVCRTYVVVLGKKTLRR